MPIVYPGDSGGAVFTTRHGGQPELAGMGIQGVSRDAAAFFHFAVAADAKAIGETFQLWRERQDRLRAGKKRQ